MTSTTVYSDVVLPAATWYEKHDLNTTDMHPFVHSFNPAIAPPWQTRTDFAIFKALVGGVQPAGRDAPGRAQGPGRGAADPRHARRVRQPARDRPRLEGRRVRPRARGEHAQARGRGARLRRRRRRSGRRWGRWSRSSGCRSRAWCRCRTRRSATCGARTARSAAARRTGGRRWPATSTGARRSSRSPAPRTAGSRRRRSSGSRSAPGVKLADLAAEHEGKLITFADTQARPVAGDHLAGVVGQRARRAALLAVHGQRRAAQAVAHADRAPALLPRPRLDDRAGRADAGVPATAGHDTRCSGSRASARPASWG